MSVTQNFRFLADLLVHCVPRKGQNALIIRMRKAAHDLTNRDKVDLVPYAYDQGLLDLVFNPGGLQINEACSLLPEITFPFDYLWIEGPNFMNEDTLATNLVPSIDEGKLGFLVRADQENHAFSFHLFNSYRTDYRLLEMGERLPLKRQKDLLPHHAGGGVNLVSPVAVRVSPEGVDLQDDEQLAYLAEKESRAFRAAGKLDDKIRLVSAHELDALLTAADFLTQFFVTLDRGVQSNFKRKTPSPSDPHKGKRHNKKKEGRKKKEVQPIESIIVRLTPPQKRALATGTRQDILREIYRVINVRRSREIVNKNGTRYYREAHVRSLTRAASQKGSAQPGQPVEDQRFAMREVRVNKGRKIRDVQPK